MGITKMRQAKYAKKALLIISDGGDNHSRYTENEIKALVKEADVMVYAIGIYDRYFPTPGRAAGPGTAGVRLQSYLADGRLQWKILTTWRMWRRKSGLNYATNMCWGIVRTMHCMTANGVRSKSEVIGLRKDCRR